MYFLLTRILAVILTFLCLTAHGQVERKVAVFDPAGRVSDDIKEIVREVISSVVVNTDGYEVLERRLIDRILEENRFQAGGLVDDDQIVEMGRLMGANLAFVSSVTALGGNFFISGKIIDVQTARILMQETAETQQGTNDLTSVVRRMVDDMLRQPETPQTVAPQQTIALQPETPQTVAPQPTQPPPPQVETRATIGNEDVRGYYSLWGIETALLGLIQDNSKDTEYYEYYRGSELHTLGLRYSLKFNSFPHFGVDFKLNLGFVECRESNYWNWRETTGQWNETLSVERGFFSHILAGPRIGTSFGLKKQSYFFSSLKFGIGYSATNEITNVRDNFNSNYQKVNERDINKFFLLMEWDIFAFQFWRFYVGPTIKINSVAIQDIFLGGKLGVDLGKRIAY